MTITTVSTAPLTGRIVFPSKTFPTVGQAHCELCGWHGPCRVLETDGPRRLTEGELRIHMRRHHDPKWEPTG